MDRVERSARRKRPDGTGVRTWRKRNVRFPPAVDGAVAAASEALGLGYSEAVEQALTVVGVPYLTDLAARSGAADKERG